MANRVVMSENNDILAVIFLGGLYLVMLMTDKKDKKEKIGGNVEDISDSNFKDKIKEGVVFVDFYATWCAPCRRMSPILESLADEMKDACHMQPSLLAGEYVQQQLYDG